MVVAGLAEEKLAELNRRLEERLRSRDKALSAGGHLPRYPVAARSSQDSSVPRDVVEWVLRCLEEGTVFPELPVRQSRLPVVGALVNRVRRQAHDLVRYHVNAQAGAQAEALGHLLLALAEIDERLHRLEEALEAERREAG